MSSGVKYGRAVLGSGRRRRTRSAGPRRALLLGVALSTVLMVSPPARAVSGAPAFEASFSAARHPRAGAAGHTGRRRGDADVRRSGSEGDPLRPGWREDRLHGRSAHLERRRREPVRSYPRVGARGRRPGRVRGRAGSGDGASLTVPSAGAARPYRSWIVARRAWCGSRSTDSDTREHPTPSWPERSGGRTRRGRVYPAGRGPRGGAHVVRHRPRRDRVGPRRGARAIARVGPGSPGPSEPNRAPRLRGGGPCGGSGRHHLRLGNETRGRQSPHAPVRIHSRRAPALDGATAQRNLQYPGPDRPGRHRVRRGHVARMGAGHRLGRRAPSGRRSGAARMPCQPLAGTERWSWSAQLPRVGPVPGRRPRPAWGWCIHRAASIECGGC